jgi:hypothetical protein
MSRCSRVTAAVAVGLFVAAACAAPAAAQSSATASIAARADVSGVAPLTAAGVNDLNFGIVAAGTPKSITNLPIDAGRFNISGEPSMAVSLSFSLPTVLTQVGGSSTIPISFGVADGLEWTPYPGTHSTFDPNAVHVTSFDGTGNASIGIAGTVSPPAGTGTGSYTGTITLTVAYQ